MLHYILRRIGQAVAVVFGVTVIAFVIIHLLPGGPARGLLGPHASAAQVRTFIVQNGYNRPLFVPVLGLHQQRREGLAGFLVSLRGTGLDAPQAGSSQQRPAGRNLVRRRPDHRSPDRPSSGRQAQLRGRPYVHRASPRRLFDARVLAGDLADPGLLLGSPHFPA